MCIMIKNKELVISITCILCLNDFKINWEISVGEDWYLMKGIGAGTVYHSRKHEGMIQSKHFEENYLMLTLVSRVVKPDENKKFITNQKTIQQWKEIYTANQIEQKTIFK